MAIKVLFENCRYENAEIEIHIQRILQSYEISPRLIAVHLIERTVVIITDYI